MSLRADRAALAAIAEDAKSCTRCPLYRNATRTVFGEGRAHASLVLVGEQPGDQEDLKGHVFVGPAGRVLDQALAEAGIDRAGLYLTNGVKHFKNEPRGKRRLHKKPNRYEVEVCKVWLTNAVKHFKNEPRGKKRLHKRPNRYEVEVCRVWLRQEISLVKPQLFLALGVTAAVALAGRSCCRASAAG